MEWSGPGAVPDTRQPLRRSDLRLERAPRLLHRDDVSTKVPPTMTRLDQRQWRLRYTPEHGDLTASFYVPALRCAMYYDRTTGYFSASALSLAMRGIEGLVRNNGHMRLVVGCTLDPPEIEAIERGEELRDVVKNKLAGTPLTPPDQAAYDALELLAWLVAHGILEVKVAIPCDEHQRPIHADGIFHEKAGIIQDAAGNRLVFVGSINETEAGWKRNWEKFHVFTSWGGDAARVEEEAAEFERIWQGHAPRLLTLDVPNAVRQDLLRFLPTDDRPARLKPPPDRETPQPEPPGPPPVDLRRRVWAFIRDAPRLPEGGERVGEATCAVEPWPHQIRAFERLYCMEAPRLLIADEVGLGKTIQAGMLIRQMWLSGRARRVLILAPAAVMRQWQIELREKFNLNWPVYDGGKLTWLPTPGMRGRHTRQVARDEWHREPAVIASSHLMRRNDRQPELCEQAEPWDLIVLDEAHHARRKGAGSASEGGPNMLLRLMRQLRHRTKGLLLLTATPMQVHPIEVWDLLDLLGVPPEWGEAAFLRFFEILEKPSPTHEEFDELARMFRATERAYGETPVETALSAGAASRLRAQRILDALRDPSNIPRRQLEGAERRAALRLLRQSTPISRLVSRHTRELLRAYYRAGKLDTPVPSRVVDDRFVDMTPDEWALYRAVETYVSATYNRAPHDKRSAVGFVMTVYRRRVASSFAALRSTLRERLAILRGQTPARFAVSEDESDDEIRDDVMDAELAAAAEREAASIEERAEIERLLDQAGALPRDDTKAEVLRTVLDELGAAGYTQVMVFTQYTATMDFLREYLRSTGRERILCFSGRGGEVFTHDGRWRTISRDDVKRRFREGQAEILLCTDAAAEGLNFQFCGAVVNYDMPWNPMRVEQRIGRIDRLGQRYAEIRIINLHYRGTVEADVYVALRQRIGLFERVVGRLQPILARLPSRITDTVLQHGSAAREQALREALRELEADAAREGAFDLDEAVRAALEPKPRPEPPLDMDLLDEVIRRPDLVPPGIEVRPLGPREYAYLAPGMEAEIRVTTNPRFFEENAESVELWSPGGAVFPDAAEAAEGVEGEGRRGWRELLNAAQG